MATLNYNWQNVASWSVTKGSATTTFWIDAKLNYQDTPNNYSVIDTRLNTTVVNRMSGSGYNFQLTGSAGTSGTAVWTFENETILTGQFRHNHDASGSASGVNIHAYVANTYLSFAQNIDAYVDLPRINRQATLTSAPNFTDEENPTINYSNPAGNNLSSVQACISLTGANDDVHYRDINKTGTSYTFQLTNEERDTLRNATTTANTRTVKFIIKSVIGSTTLYSSLERTLTIVNANPIFTDFEFEDINATTTALTGNNKFNINGYSTIKATIPVANKAVAQKSATMSKYRLTIDDSSTDKFYSDDSNVSMTLQNAKSGTYNIYAIDSRSNSTLVTKLAQKVIQYVPIYIDKQSTKVERNNNQVGGSAVLTLKGTFWNDNFGQVDNDIQITYKFKKSDSSTWINGTTTITPTITDGEFTFSGQIASDNQDTSWDLDSSYNVKIVVEDELTITEYEMILNSAIPTMSIDREGVGIMCAYDTSIGGALQVNGERIDVENTETYSTDEITTNKIWIDDKPIYRKVFTYSTPSRNVTSWSNIANISGLKIDTVTSLKGTFETFEKHVKSINYFETSGEYFLVMLYGKNNIWYRKAHGTAGVDKVVIILEYTKTTD